MADFFDSKRGHKFDFQEIEVKGPVDNRVRFDNLGKQVSPEKVATGFLFCPSSGGLGRGFAIFSTSAERALESV